MEEVCLCVQVYGWGLLVMYNTHTFNKLPLLAFEMDLEFGRKVKG